MHLAVRIGMPQLDELSAQLDRLAAFEPGPYPVVSLYLNLQPNARGRSSVEPFLRKELGNRIDTYAETPERQSLQRDAERIERYLDGVAPSANGLAVFACDGTNLFEAFQFAAPIELNRLCVSEQPHLYPLARLLDEYRRYLVLLADTNQARIFVFAVNAAERKEHIERTKTKRHKSGGMSQARYRRHLAHYHQQHAAEIAEVITRTVRDEKIDQVIISGDRPMVALLREHLPKDVDERIVDVLKLNVRTPESTIVDATIAAMRAQDAQTDRERVDQLLGEYRANGLACLGLEATERALGRGQVDELVIAASPDAITDVKTRTAAGEDNRTATEQAADSLITAARNTSATIRFIEDTAIAASIRGVGAFLRFKS
jgi:peptide chain release factor subunit 1